MASQQSYEVKNPTEHATRKMVQQANDLRTAMNDDDDDEQLGLFNASSCLRLPNSSLPSLTLAGAGSGAASGAGSGLVAAKAAAKSQAQQSSKSKARAAERPGVTASKLRQGTLKAWTQTCSEAQRAARLGEQMLLDCLAEHGSEEGATLQDPSFKVVKLRSQCLAKLLDNRREKPTVETGEALLQMLGQDSYLGEQAWQPTHVQTLGQMAHVRGTLMELQRTSEAVTRLGDAHRSAIDVLKVVAKSVSSEAAQWRANLAALRKARDLEQKMLNKEAERQKAKEERERKAEKKRREKVEKKRREAEQKARDQEDEKARLAAAAAEEAAGGESDDNEKANAEGGAKKKKRKAASNNRVIADESDPQLLKSFCDPTWPDGNRVRRLDSIDELVQLVASTAGMLPAVVRFRRSSLKKILDAAWLSFMMFWHCFQSGLLLLASVLKVLSLSLGHLRLALAWSTTRARASPR